MLPLNHSTYHLWICTRHVFIVGLEELRRTIQAGDLKVAQVLLGVPVVPVEVCPLTQAHVTRRYYYWTIL